jgi:hypothetical protein
MASERSPVIDYTIIGLLLLNLGVTSYLVFKPSSSAVATESAASTSNVSEVEANKLAAEVTKLYNAKDDTALFNKFDSIAKAQLTQEQLTAQLSQLYPLMGTISDTAFSSAVLAGSDSGRDYYNLNYKVRLTGGPFNTGDMKLTVTRREGDLGLVGFFINGTSQPGGK